MKNEEETKWVGCVDVSRLGQRRGYTIPDTDAGENELYSRNKAFSRSIMLRKVIALESIATSMSKACLLLQPVSDVCSAHLRNEKRKAKDLERRKREAANDL